MPLRSMSRVWGKFNALDLPTWSRRPLLSIYVHMFGCNLEEAAIEDLQYYRNLGEFFRRSLKPGVRPISTDYSLVSIRVALPMSQVQSYFVCDDKTFMMLR